MYLHYTTRYEWKEYVSRKKKKQQSYQNINNTYLKYPSKVDN